MRTFWILFFGLLLLGLAAGTTWFVRRQIRADFETSGGTVLVYEIDKSAKPKMAFRPEDLISAVKRRLDSADLGNISVRLLDPNHVEIRISRISSDFATKVHLCKELMAQVGLLEFRILANLRDDKDGIAAAEKFLVDPRNKGKLEKAALTGKPPPPPSPPDADGFNTTRPDELGKHTYSWVELGCSERADLNLDNAAGKDPKRNQLWKRAAQARSDRTGLELSDPSKGDLLLYSRQVQDPVLLKNEADKNFEYFFLTRNPRQGKEVTGNYLDNAKETEDRNGRPSVGFHFNRDGGELFYELTSTNAPGPKEGEISFGRRLAILLDNQIMSAPVLNQAIRSDGEISGHFTPQQVSNLVTILRAGAFPVPLKPIPVSETEVLPKSR